MNRNFKNIGWSIFFLDCADKTLFAGITRNLEKELIEIRVFKKGVYFNNHPERFPVTVVFKETNLTFKEAHAKLKFMRKMNKKMKRKLIGAKKWPVGGSLKKFIENKEIDYI